MYANDTLMRQRMPMTQVFTLPITAMKILTEISTKFYTTPQMVSGQSASIKYGKD